MLAIDPNPGAVPRHPRYYSLDAWRGLACLLIVIYHSGGPMGPSQGVWGSLVNGFLALRSSMWLGVPLFFVISGYCISATMENMRERPRGVRSYFLRRLRRIYPPYIIFLMVFMLWCLPYGLMRAPDGVTQGLAITAPWDLTLPQWVGNLTLTETWREHLIGPSTALMAGQCWSLCHEEQFYLIVGLILMLAPQRYFSVMAILSLGVMGVACLPKSMSAMLAGTSLRGSWLIFACGVIAYWQVNHAASRGRWIGNVILLALMALCFRSPSNLWQVQESASLQIFVATNFALFLSNADMWDEWIAKIWVARLLAWCGRISYSVYLVHIMPVFMLRHLFQSYTSLSPELSVFVLIPLSVGASFGLGKLFYLLVESRFLNVSSRQSAPVSHIPLPAAAPLRQAA